MTQAEVIEVPTFAYRPIPHELTTKIEKPQRPAAKCVFKGAPAICVLAALKLIPLYGAIVDMANADRATTEQLGRTDGTE